MPFVNPALKKPHFLPNSFLSAELIALSLVIYLSGVRSHHLGISPLKKSRVALLYDLMSLDGAGPS